MAFEPHFILTAHLLKSIAEVERLYGQLEGMRISEQLLLNLERSNLCESTYVSNSIEGNPLSLPEVTNLLLDGRVPANRDEREVKNYFEILQSLPEQSGKQLDVPTVLAMHKKLLSGVQDDIAGTIRDTRVVVGRRKGDGTLHVRHEPPMHDRQRITEYLDRLLTWIRESSDPAMLKAGIFHHEFVYLHPFVDGNGRTCRLLTALVLLQGGYQINRYFVLDDYYDVDRELYADSLRSADRGDTTAWLEYFTDGMLYSLKSAKARLERGLRELGRAVRPTQREHDVLQLFDQRGELTSEDVVAALSVSRQQAHKLLHSLVKKGFLRKKGTTKGSHYLLR